MASLREKLLAASAPRKAPVKKRAEDCYHRETRFPLRDFTLPEWVSGEKMTLIQGKEYSDCRRENICFLDTETTGLSRGAGTVAFLVGIGFFEEDAFVVHQYLMRDYDEEPFLLAHVAEHMAKSQLLCTFNGAAFDLPLLEARFIMQRMRDSYPVRPHLDLLHPARRVWKLRLKKCNLTSLEEAVLGFAREDDLPGALVPERFFQYLKSRDFELLEDVLEHNTQDIASLALILDRLLRYHDLPLAYCQAAEDLFSVGRIYEKRGKREEARQCYRAADQGSISALARDHLAASLRREGNYEEAARIYSRMIAAHQGGAAPLIAMAKISEHKKGNIPEAIEYTRRAIILSAEKPDADLRDLQKRYQRLMEKSRRNHQ